MRDLQNLSSQQWLDRASRTVPLILTIVLVVAIAWQLVQLTWLLLDRKTADSPVVIAPPPASAVNAPRKAVNVQSIVDAHLFGAPKSAAPQDASTAPQAQMNLVLAGTWAAEDPSKGYAFIGESANAARMYGVGKPVRTGTLLHAVYPDRAILDTSGKLEALVLPRLSASTFAALPRAEARPQANQFTDNLRRIAETNPSAFAEVVRPQPVFANGVQRGYRVYPGRNRQQFAKLGLQPGDLVLSINGTPLDDPQRGMEIFNTMGDADRVTVTVERNGQPQELSLNTGQLSLPEASPPPERRRQRPTTNAPGTTPE